MRHLKTAIVAFVRDERGLTMVEYAIAGALVTAAAVAAFTLLGGNVSTQITNLAGVVVPAPSREEPVEWVGSSAVYPFFYLTTTRVLSSDDRPRSVKHVQPFDHAGCRNIFRHPYGTHSELAGWGLT